MTTQLNRVKDYICQHVSVTIWELEEWGVQSHKMSAGSCTRHARQLKRLGVVKHPVKDGKIDVHAFEYINLNYKNGQGELF